MLVRNIRIALLTGVAFPVAFDSGTPGWKKEGDKLAVDADGNPIYINAAGQEQSIKHDTIATLNHEAKTHRTAKEMAEAQLKKYRDESGKLIDPETAVKAIETVAKIDAKTLIDAGEVDKVRETIKGEYEAKLKETGDALGEARSQVKKLTIDKVFDGSEFVRERIATPLDMFKDSFSKNFKVGEDGKIEAYDRNGNRLMSKKNTGEFATPDEALELLVEMHPQKDVILKAQQQGGTGNQGGGGNRGTGRTVKRADFEKMGPGEQAQAAASAGKGELTIVD